MKKTFLVLALTFSFFADAQRDTEFWFSAPEIENQHDRPILLRITSFDDPATINVSIPANPGFTALSVPIAANASTTIDLTAWIGIIENTTANTVLDRGLLITASAEIMVYYEVVSANVFCGGCSPELFSLKGKNALGNEFIIPSQTRWHIDTIRYPTARNSFDIVATEDNTVVTITPSRPLIGRPANIPFSVTLNRGQTFSNQGLYRNNINMLSGSKVSADKPIAITSRQDLLFADGPCADLTGDQLIPVDIFGVDFVVIRGDLFNRDRVVIVAAYDNTEIFIDANPVPVTTINSGQYYEFDLITQPSVYIQSSNKISVLHYTGLNCEISSAVIPKLSCTGSTEISVVKSINESAIVFVVTQNGNQGNFTVNGNGAVLTAADFSPVAGTAGNYVFCKKEISASMPLGSATRIINSSGLFQLGFLNGASPTLQTGCRYGYFSDFKSINVQASHAEVCLGDSVQLNAFGGVIYQWTPVSGLNNPNIPNPKVSPNVTTDYTVIVTSIDGCIDSAKVRVTVKPLPGGTITGDTICEGETGELLFQATAGTGPFSISFADPSSTYTINNVVGNNVIYTAPTIPATTDYSLLYIEDITGCRYEPLSATTTIVVNPLPVIQVTDDATICEGSNISLSANGGISYLWSPSVGLSSVVIPDPVANPSVTTKYYVIVTDINSCFATDSVEIVVNPAPDADAGSDTLICPSSSVMLQGASAGGTTFLWMPSVSLNDNTILNPVASPVSETLFYFTATDVSGCSKTDSVFVGIIPPPVFTVNNPLSVCLNEGVQLNASGGHLYVWDPPTFINNPTVANPVANPPSSINYSVNITDTICGNMANLSTSIIVFPQPVVQASKSNDIDCSNDRSQLTATGAVQYSWSPAGTLNNASIANPMAMPVTATHYTVTGTDANGCSNTASVMVNVDNTNQGGYLMPTAFTPNNDGLNDCYGIKYWGVVEKIDFSIFNRWGERVFHTSNSRQCWNGIYKGVLQDAGVYVYMIRAKTSCDANVFRKGTFVLIR